MAKKVTEIKLTAASIYDKFADSNGFVSLSCIEKLGWTKAKAEEEGLVIKETYKTCERV